MDPVIQTIVDVVLALIAGFFGGKISISTYNKTLTNNSNNKKMVKSKVHQTIHGNNNNQGVM